MKRLLLTLPAIVFVIFMYMGILLVLVRMNLVLSEIQGGLLYTLARCGELCAGVALLLGGTLLTTRLAVWLFPSSCESEN